MDCKISFYSSLIAFKSSKRVHYGQSRARITSSDTQLTVSGIECPWLSEAKAEVDHFAQ